MSLPLPIRNTMTGAGRIANAPRFLAQRNWFETWDVRLSLAEGGFALKHLVAAGTDAASVAQVGALWQPFDASPPSLFRAAVPDPHLGLAPPHTAGFARRLGPILDFPSMGPEVFAAYGSRPEEVPPNATASGWAALFDSSAAGSLAAPAVGGTSRVDWSISWVPEEASTWQVPPPFLPAKRRFNSVTRAPKTRATGSITFGGPKGAERTVEFLESEACQTHTWGGRPPSSWVGAWCSEWSGAGSDLSFSAFWGRRRRLGLLGPPIPKTFIIVDEGPDHSGKLFFNGPIRALTSSSTVKFPRWEARAIGDSVKATIRISVIPDLTAQVRWDLPDGSHHYVATTLGAIAELVMERRSGGRWIRAETAYSERCMVEFGQESPIPLLPVMGVD